MADSQDGTNGKVLVPAEFSWHLGEHYTELSKAREAVKFTDPRTRIAHLDTGYYRSHETVPEYVLRHLEKNFVRGDADPGSAEDPDNRLLVFDNSGHGTGTISILAGGKSKAVEEDERSGTPRHVFRGGSTLVVDLSVPEAKYRIMKNIKSENRQERTAAFIREAAADPLRALFFANDRREPFAVLHSLAGDGL